MLRPILRATLFALHSDRVQRLGGYSAVTLADLAREYREGDGDCGICFEYAVHDAIRNRSPLILPLVSEVLETFCKIRGEARSILFGAEKGRKLELVETDSDLLTPESRLLVGARGQPVKLMRHLDSVRRAFSRPDAREQLPRSIRGLWRADLFLGVPERDQWVATTLKTNPTLLEGDAGIRIGIYPEREMGEAPSFDEGRNLILCPLPYDGSFMELFYATFFLVKSFLGSDARLPRREALPLSVDRQVATMLEQRRQFSLLMVIDAFEQFAQPGLLVSGQVGQPFSDETTSAIAPVALVVR